VTASPVWIVAVLGFQTGVAPLLSALIDVFDALAGKPATARAEMTPAASAAARLT
jgi:hypothetical protein